MTLEILSWAAVVLILATSAVILANRDWRLSLGALTLQYFAAFWLITRHLPFVMGSAKLITGWMVVAILGMTKLGLSAEAEENAPTFLPRGQWFRLILFAAVALAAAGATPRIESGLPGLGLQVIAGSLFLIGAGMIHLGAASDIFNTILGLLTMIAGFEVLYAAIESSLLVTGLLAVANLGLGLSGAYLLTAGTVALESEETL
ncbi:MAG: hypothetical protein LDL50_07515 [Chloroflexi bacterium]|nr:hypothetical protein [Chloroflexota bacterium]MCA2000754.1 hypothetical protein [Chloroflexota bacterium]